MEEILFEGMTMEERLLFRRLVLQINENLDKHEGKKEYEKFV